MEDQPLTPEEIRNLRQLIKSAQVDVDMAQMRIEALLRSAHKAGISYRKLGQWLGVTEAAIRLKFKRRKWND